MFCKVSGLYRLVNRREKSRLRLALSALILKAPRVVPTSTICLKKTLSFHDTCEKKVHMFLSALLNLQMKYLKFQVTLKCNINCHLSGGTCRARVTYKDTPGWWRRTTLNKDQQRQEGLGHWTLPPSQTIASIVCIGCQGSVMGYADCFSCFSVPSQRILPLRAKSHLGSAVQCKHSQIMALIRMSSHQKCQSVNTW